MVNAKGAVIVAALAVTLLLAANPQATADGEEPLWTYTTGGDALSVSISSNGSYIVAGSYDSTIYLFSKADNTPLWSYETGDKVRSVSISSDGSYIAAGSMDGKVYLFSKEDNTPLWSSPITLVYGWGIVSISSDGSYIAAGGSTAAGEIYLFSKEDNTPLWVSALGEEINTVSISSDGAYIAAGSEDYKVHLFSKESSTPLWSHTATSCVDPVAISSDGSYLTAGDSDGYIYLFSKESSTPLWIYHDSWSTARSVSISSDGSYIATGNDAGNVHFFSKESSTPLWSYTTGDGNEVSISSDSSHIVAGSFDDKVYLFLGIPPEPPVVTTNPATDVTATGATLNGTLVDIGGYSSVNLFFQFRELGVGWVSTGKTTATAPQSFSVGIYGLKPYTTYEFWAVAEYGSYAYGSIGTFTTSKEFTGEEEEEVPPGEEGEEGEEGPLEGVSDWYREYMRRIDRPENAPFPIPPPYVPFDPVPLLVPLGILLAVLFPKDRWGETPKNWAEASAPGSWTFVTAVGVFLLGAALVSSGWILLEFGINEMSATYAVITAFASLVFISETKPKSPGAFIGIGTKDRIRLAVFGILLGAFFLFLMSWIGGMVGMSIVVMQVAPIPLLPIVLIGLAIPFLEEYFFRATLTPTFAEKLGIVIGVGACGLAFGFAHLIFGASLFMFATATAFGCLVSYFTLRQQSIIPGLSGHITYNTLVLILPYIIGGLV